MSVLKKILGDVAEAAPRKKQDPAMKEALKQFAKPEMAEARFNIAKHRGLGMDTWEVNMSLPVSVEFLKAKDQDFKVNDFAKFGSSDPIELLAMMANQEIEKRTGLRLRRPSISTVDLARQRAKNGMKTVSMSWEVPDALTAYALGMDLDKWGGSSELAKSKEEVQKRMADAKQTAEESLKLRQQLKAEQAAGTKTEEQANAEWKAFAEACNAKGMNYEIFKMHKLGANVMSRLLTPMLHRILAENVEMPKDEFLKEHEHLLEVLDHPNKENLKEEHDTQLKEAKQYGLKHQD